MIYKRGHRDARHAAAKIALAGDAEIIRLRAMIEAANAKLAEVMRERDDLRDALRNIADPLDGKPCGNPWGFYADLNAAAMRALGVKVDAMLSSPSLRAAAKEYGDLVEERDYLLDQHRAILELMKNANAYIGNDSVRSECGLMIVTMEDYLK